MTDFRIDFNNPWLLLLFIPVLLLIFIPFFRIPRRFRGTRNRVISVVLHTLASALCICLIAGVSFSFNVPNRENQLMIVVDASDSNAEQAAKKDEYVQNILNMCGEGYQVGIVKFGLNTVYAAPLSYDTRDSFRQYLGSADPDLSATNIAGALDFAAKQFDNPKTSKIVLLSDGLETDGAALAAVQLAAATGIKVDTIEFANDEPQEIQLLSAEMPQSRIVLGTEALLTLTVESRFEGTANVAVTVTDNGFAGEAQSFTIAPGQQTLTIRHEFQSAGLHDLLFSIEGSEDTETQNNTLRSYINISLLDDVLILENIPGEADSLESILSENYTVNVLNIRDDAALLPKTAKEMCAYQNVVLVNMANSDLTDSEIGVPLDEILYDYVYTYGGSMLTVGGENDTGADGNPVPHAYNRSDLAGTLFQEMLPVDAIDYSPPIAVMLVIDSSGSMSSGRFPAALQGAEETLNVLNDRDFCGVMTFSTSSSEEVSVLPVSQRETIREAIRNLGSGEGGSAEGGTVFAGAIDRAGRALASIQEAERKHIVLITDGDPSDSLEEPTDGGVWYGQYIDYNYEQGITLSVITIGASSGNMTQMRETAERGHGNYFNVELTDPNLGGTVGSYMQQDLAEVTLSEIQDGEEFIPTIEDHTSIFTNIDTRAIPALTGYYGTRAKSDASVQLIHEYVPIYASHAFGKGNVGSFMCDLSGIWSAEFISDDTGRQLIKNIAESLAPLNELQPDLLDFVLEQTEDNYSNRLKVYTDLAEGESIRVTVEPVSQSGQIVTVTPSSDNVSFNFSIRTSGVYRITIEKIVTADPSAAPLASVQLYKSFSYSEEYDAIRDADEGKTLLASLAQDSGGSVITDPAQIFTSFEEFLHRIYDPRLILLIVAMVCILLDIAVRKFKFKWIHEIIRDKRTMKELNEPDRQGALSPDERKGGKI